MIDFSRPTNTKKVFYGPMQVFGRMHHLSFKTQSHLKLNIIWWGVLPFFAAVIKYVDEACCLSKLPHTESNYVRRGRGLAFNYLTSYINEE